MTIRIVETSHAGRARAAECPDCGEIWRYDPDGEPLAVFALLHAPADVVALAVLDDGVPL